jgi:hypothetical protein
MPSSFRPVALRLPLTEVAALAAATARSFFSRDRRERPLAFAFRLSLRAIHANAQMGWTTAPEFPESGRQGA